MTHNGRWVAPESRDGRTFYYLKDVPGLWAIPLELPELPPREPGSHFFHDFPFVKTQVPGEVRRDAPKMQRSRKLGRIPPEKPSYRL